MIAIASSWASSAEGVLHVDAEVAGNALSGSGSGTADWRGFAIFPLAGDAASMAMPGTLNAYLTALPGPPDFGAEPEQEPEQESRQPRNRDHAGHTQHVPNSPGNSPNTGKVPDQQANSAIQEWRATVILVHIACGLVLATTLGWL